MTALYLDCFSGAAGDMLVGALLDTGAVGLEDLRLALRRLPLPDVRVEAQRAWRGGLAGTRFRVHSDETDAPHRTLPDVLALLERAELPVPVVRRAVEVFHRLARAEAHVHGCSEDEVHFHEVGAADSIVDVVSFCFLHHQLGEPRVLCSPLAVGEGFVSTAHGRIPVPAMATFELLRGLPIEMSGIREELVTPTGAALIGSFAEEFGRGFSFTVERVGYGLGTRDRDNPPNAVRAVLATEPTPRCESVSVLETNLDDITGQELARLVELCMQNGALDVTVLPALMKKGRAGHVVQVLAPVAIQTALCELLLRESPTLGVRFHRVQRQVLPREERQRTTSLGTVRVKEVTRPPGHTELIPEFDEVQRLAAEHGLSLSQVRSLLQRELDASQPEDGSSA